MSVTDKRKARVRLLYNLHRVRGAIVCTGTAQNSREEHCQWTKGKRTLKFYGCLRTRKHHRGYSHMTAEQGMQREVTGEDKEGSGARPAGSEGGDDLDAHVPAGSCV